MPQTIDDILAAADWGALNRKLLVYADWVLCSAKWREARLVLKSDANPCGDGHCAEDAVKEAVWRFLNCEREYQPSVGLEQNLKGAIRSIISSWWKTSNRQPLIELAPVASADGSFPDPIQEVADPRLAEECAVVRADRIAHQRKALENFRAEISGDKELSAVFDLLSSGDHKPRHMEQASGIRAARISELKRKLRTKMKAFIQKHPAAALALEK